MKTIQIPALIPILPNRQTKTTKTTTCSTTGTQPPQPPDVAVVTTKLPLPYIPLPIQIMSNHPQEEQGTNNSIQSELQLKPQQDPLPQQQQQQQQQPLSSSPSSSYHHYHQPTTTTTTKILKTISKSSSTIGRTKLLLSTASACQCLSYQILYDDNNNDDNDQKDMDMDTHPSKNENNSKMIMKKKRKKKEKLRVTCKTCKALESWVCKYISKEMIKIETLPMKKCEDSLHDDNVDNDHNRGSDTNQHQQQQQQEQQQQHHHPWKWKIHGLGQNSKKVIRILHPPPPYHDHYHDNDNHNNHDQKKDDSSTTTTATTANHYSYHQVEKKESYEDILQMKSILRFQNANYHHQQQRQEDPSTITTTTKTTTTTTTTTTTAGDKIFLAMKQMDFQVDYVTIQIPEVQKEILSEDVPKGAVTMSSPTPLALPLPSSSSSSSSSRLLSSRNDKEEENKRTNIHNSHSNAHQYSKNVLSVQLQQQQQIPRMLSSSVVKKDTNNRKGNDVNETHENAKVSLIVPNTCTTKAKTITAVEESNQDVPLAEQVSSQQQKISCSSTSSGTSKGDNKITKLEKTLGTSTNAASTPLSTFQKPFTNHQKHIPSSPYSINLDEFYSRPLDGQMEHTATNDDTDNDHNKKDCDSDHTMHNHKHENNDDNKSLTRDKNDSAIIFTQTMCFKNVEKDSCHDKNIIDDGNGDDINMKDCANENHLSVSMSIQPTTKMMHQTTNSTTTKNDVEVIELLSSPESSLSKMQLDNGNEREHIRSKRTSDVGITKTCIRFKDEQMSNHHTNHNHERNHIRPNNTTSLSNATTTATRKQVTVFFLHRGRSMSKSRITFLQTALAKKFDTSVISNEIELKILNTFDKNDDGMLIHYIVVDGLLTTGHVSLGLGFKDVHELAMYFEKVSLM